MNSSDLSQQRGQGTYRCQGSACPMAAVAFPEAAAGALNFRCSVCGTTLLLTLVAEASSAQTLTRSYPAGLSPDDLPTHLAHPWKAYWEEEHPRIQLAWLTDIADLCVRWAVALVGIPVDVNGHSVGM